MVGESERLLSDAVPGGDRDACWLCLDAESERVKHEPLISLGCLCKQRAHASCAAIWYAPRVVCSTTGCLSKVDWKMHFATECKTCRTPIGDDFTLTISSCFCKQSKRVGFLHMNSEQNIQDLGKTVGVLYTIRSLIEGKEPPQPEVSGFAERALATTFDCIATPSRLALAVWILYANWPRPGLAYNLKEYLQTKAPALMNARYDFVDNAIAAFCGVALGIATTLLFIMLTVKPR